MSLWEKAGELAGAEEPGRTDASRWRRFAPAIGLVGLCWLVFLINNVLLGAHLNRYGIVPRHLAGIPGIVFAPFLHGSFQHLLANTVPLFLLAAVICGRSTREFALVTFGGIVLGGGLTWLFARTASHIGASGLVFCFFGYIGSLAYFRRTIGTLLLSGICIIVYGGILKGIVPHATPVSWESHIAGLIAGIVLAWAGSRLSRPTNPLASAEPANSIRP